MTRCSDWDTYLEEVWAEDEEALLSWWPDLVWQVWLRPLLLQVSKWRGWQCVWAVWIQNSKLPEWSLHYKSVAQVVCVYGYTCTCGAGGFSIWGLRICNASSWGLCFFLNFPSGLLKTHPHRVNTDNSSSMLSWVQIIQFKPWTCARICLDSIIGLPKSYEAFSCL